MLHAPLLGDMRDLALSVPLHHLVLLIAVILPFHILVDADLLWASRGLAFFGLGAQLEGVVVGAHVREPNDLPPNLD